MKGLKKLTALLLAGGVGILALALPVSAQNLVLDHCIFEWDMAADTSVTGFNLYISSTAGGPYTKLATVPAAATQATESVHYVTLNQCTGVPDGTKFAVVKATTSLGTETSPSNEVTWVLSMAVANKAPIVNAGVDKVITLPTNNVTLGGTATDDGLPNPPGAMTFQWSKVSGPGEVAFSTPNSLATSAMFNAAGVYVLRLKADDSLAFAQDDVQVTVNPEPIAPPVVASLSLINADTDQPIAGYDPMLPSSSINLATLPSRNISIRANTTPVVVGSVRFGLNSNPQFVMENQPPYVIAGDATRADGTKDILPWAVPLGVNTVTVTAFSLASGGGVASEPYQITLTVTDVAPNKAPVVSAGADQTVSRASTVLVGTATDDGLPTGSALTVTWSMVSGPAPATFSATNTLISTVTFTRNGTYTFRLTVSDGALSSSDDVVIRVSAPPGQLKVR